MRPDPTLEAAARLVREALLGGPVEPSLAVVLGSGWGVAADGLAGESGLDYGEIPGLGTASVAGHRGRLGTARVGEGLVLLFSGRSHLYEGATARDAARSVDLAALLGCPRVLLTCAAGSVNPALGAGELVRVGDHINLMGDDPASGTGDGTLFPDRSAVYDTELGERLHRVATDHGVTLHAGVLAALRGPGYETPAEVRALGRLGADVVSMSVVPEALRASDLGLRVAALAAVANPGAGLGGSALRHDEVLATVGATLHDRGPFFRAALEALAR